MVLSTLACVAATGGNFIWWKKEKSWQFSACWCRRTCIWCLNEGVRKVNVNTHYCTCHLAYLNAEYVKTACQEIFWMKIKAPFLSFLDWIQQLQKRLICLYLSTEHCQTTHFISLLYKSLLVFAGHQEWPLCSLLFFLLSPPIVVSGRERKIKRHGTAQPSSASWSTFRCHCPEIGTQLRGCLFSIKWKNLSAAKRVDTGGGGGGGRSVEDTGRNRAQKRHKSKYAVRGGTFFKTGLSRLWCCERMEALCLTFLQRLSSISLSHTHTFGRPEITEMSASPLFCLPKWWVLSILQTLSTCHPISALLWHYR